MAGDWIPMRTNLEDDPAVISMGRALKLQTDHVVGKLHRFWSWADSHTEDGFLHGVDSAWIDQHVKKRGFAAAMAAINPPWLLVTTDGISIPNFCHWFGASAKRRLADARRKQLLRSCGQKSANGADILRTEIGPQYSTEEESTYPPTTTTAEPIGDDVTWGEVVAELSEIGMGAPDKACETARVHGVLAYEAMAAVRHWQANEGAWGIGFLYKAIEKMQPDRRVNWPAPSAGFLQKAASGAREQKALQQVADRENGQRERTRLAAEREAMEAEGGAALDALTLKQVRAIIEEKWPKESESFKAMLPKQRPITHWMLRGVLLEELRSRRIAAALISEETL